MEVEGDRYTAVDVDMATLKDAIYDFAKKPPAQASFALLEFIQSNGRFLASSINFAEISASISPTQVAAMTSQGERIAGSIFRRIRSAMGREVRELYRFNKIYRNKPYAFSFKGEHGIVSPQSFMIDVAVFLSADPELSSDVARYNRISLLEGMVGHPVINQQELMMRILTLAREDHPEKLIAQPQPDPKIELDKKRLELDAQRLQMEMRKAGVAEQSEIAKIQHLLTQIRKIQADAQVAVGKLQDDAAKTQVQAFKVRTDALIAAGELELGRRQLAAGAKVSAAKTNGQAHR